MSQEQSAGQLGGAAAAGIGIAAGVVGPLALPIGMAVGGTIGGLFGGNSAQKKASENTDKRHKWNKKIWRFENKERERKYEYQVEALGIRKQNDADNINFQEQVSQNNYDHGMAIRQFQFNQERRAYEASIDAAEEQIGFNDMAANFANIQQDRAHSEQLISLMFDEQQTLLDYNVQTTGLMENMDKMSLKADGLKRSARRDTQAQRLEGLKAAGTARNVGSGRSGAKAMQAAIAEAGANQAAIADELMFGLSDLNLDLASINNKMESMSNQLILDQTMLSATKDNVDARNRFVQKEIQLNRLNADNQALSSIRMKPEINPPLPEPIALPRPEYQDIYKPKNPPKPKRILAKTGGYSPGTSGINTLMPNLVAGIQTFAQAGVFGDGFK